MHRTVNQKRKTWWVKEYVRRKWRNWCQNEVDEETTVKSTFTSRPGSSFGNFVC